MRRLALGACAAILLSTGPALAVSDPSELLPNTAQEARAEAIGSRLRCLVCQNESIEASDADLARDLRAIIRQKVAGGESDRQIVTFMVHRYGTFILLTPPFEPLTLLLWGSPVLALAAGAGVVLLALRQRRLAASSAPAPLTEAERARLDDLLRS